MKWKNIKGYENLYKVSNTGIIYSKKNNLELKPFINNNGYYEIVLRKDKKQKHFRIHRLVAEAFIKNDRNCRCVNHIDGNKLNNNVKNLEWCTYSENMKHAAENNLLHNKGKKVKVNQYDLNGKYIKTWNSMKEIENEYNISHTVIRFCCIGKNKTCRGYKWRYYNEVNNM